MYTEHKGTQVFTDAPAKIIFAPGGLFGADSPCNAFVTWKASYAENPLTSQPLCVRWAYNGQRVFENSNRRSAVDDHSYMILNHGSEYSSYIESETQVQCYSVCFLCCMVEDVLHGSTMPTDRLLDDPRGDSNQEIVFLEHPHPHDEFVSPVLRRLERLTETCGITYGWLEEQFRWLAAGMLQAHRNVFHEVEQMPALRASTRLELYRRLHLARNYMEASLDESLTLEKIAAVGWFSPYHFLRAFKQVFHETPHQFLTRKRLARAQQLLTNTDLPVTQICFAVGFESLGSFSTLFRRHVGVAPAVYRSQFRSKAVAFITRTSS